MSIDTVVPTGPKKSAFGFGFASIALIVLGIAFLWISNEIVADTGYTIIAVLLFLPLLLAIAGVLGLVAIILSIVMASKSKGKNKAFITPLILGIISFVVSPLSALILIWGAG